LFEKQQILLQRNYLQTKKITVMKRETKIKREMNRKLFSDDSMDESQIQFELYQLQRGINVELNPELDKDLFSGHDVIDIDVDLDDDYVLLDSYLTSQIISFYN
jgi:hypothetical protein